MTYHNRRRSSSVLTEDEYANLYSRQRDPGNKKETDLDIDFTKETLYPWLYERDERERSESYSSTNSGDSEDCTYTPLEIRHFENALNNGVFSRSTRKKRHRLTSRTSLEEFDFTSTRFSKQDSETFQIERRPRSHSTRTIQEHDATPHHLQRFFCRSNSHEPKCSKQDKTSHLRKRTLESKLNEKLRKELSNSGIDLHDASDLPIDEIHALQQKFYTGMKLNRRSSDPEDNSIIQSHQKKRDRSISFN